MTLTDPKATEEARNLAWVALVASAAGNLVVTLTGLDDGAWSVVRIVLTVVLVLSVLVLVVVWLAGSRDDA